MQFLAPAKINLTLTVKGRRDDGFHELESLVCPISLFDTLEITPRDCGGLEFVCDDPTLPTDETNLVVRAARLFCSSCGLEPHLHLDLAKRIPHGAGLGGGSSDAAATLFGLNRVFQTALSLDALSAMAAELGSDIPLFLHHSAAVIRGRGEQVEPVAFPHTLPLFLIKPPFGVPTPWAYRRWKEAREIPGVPYAPQEFAWGRLHNDLERPVFEKYLLLALLKRWLLAQPEVAGALMSGSGATVFAVLRARDASVALGERLVAEFGAGLWCCLAETVG
ncbi:MAG: 4-diphosphocytidyl-2-C-methyl-D-erythritol kinase [Chthoniobacter sp.]|jgi:4-diphosphocytidyl-2-C-methyl-D-erythritol kinase|nr:4-diphosphocytidyl-2-C-methyl-D-erythritol kinase [Chthoniobacter sp.]